MLSLSTKDAGSHLGKNLIIDQEHGRGIIKKELVADVFVADAPKKVADYFVANFRTSHKDKNVYIIGGRNSAGQSAVYLSKFADKVYIVLRKDSLSYTMSFT